MVTTRFQHLHWPQLGCVTLGNYLISGSFTLCAICQIKALSLQSYVHIQMFPGPHMRDSLETPHLALLEHDLQRM